MDIKADISVLGLPEIKANQLRKKNINTVEDVLDFLPIRYNSYFDTLAVATDGDYAITHIKIKKIQKMPTYVKVTGTDLGLGKDIFVLWFHCDYMLRLLFEGEVYTVGGQVKFNSYTGQHTFINPEIWEDADYFKTFKPAYPVYGNIRGMASKYIKDVVIPKALAYAKEEYLTDEFIKTNGLCREEDVYRLLHQPTYKKDTIPAKRRYVFDKIHKYLTDLNNSGISGSKPGDIFINKNSLCEDYIDSLPYELTSDQLNVINDLLKETEKGNIVNSLIQGDVGCGKTSVALALAIASVCAGYQVVIAAPTCIVANQHYDGIADFMLSRGKTVALFTSKECYLNGVKISKAKLLKFIESGDVNLIIGTHSVISDKVVYKNLGLAVIDEEHKFGVAQKNAFDKYECNKITMTATPIPRSLSMTLYGNLFKFYTINAMPSGRKK